MQWHRGHPLTKNVPGSKIKKLVSLWLWNKECAWDSNCFAFIFCYNVVFVEGFSRCVVVALGCGLAVGGVELLNAWSTGIVVHSRAENFSCVRVLHVFRFIKHGYFRFKLFQTCKRQLVMEEHPAFFVSSVKLIVSWNFLQKVFVKTRK